MAAGSWTELSEALVEAVRDAAGAVVRIDGRRRGSSSGIAWSPDGTVVTASHGLDSDDEVEIGLPSGETVAAEVVGRDASTDLAVLRAKATLSAAQWSEAPLQVGQLVLCVTRPGRGPKAGLGIVSRLGDSWRTPFGGKLDRYVELDLGLHPGFSGGLLLDMSGRGLALATAGLVRGTPIGVPAATLKKVVKAILAHGGVRRGYLGVASVPVRLPEALANEASQPSALLVTEVEPGSPAARAGLTVGDLLLALDGAALGHMGDLVPLLEEERIGEQARVRIARGGVVREIQLTIGARGGAARQGRCEP